MLSSNRWLATSALALLVACSSSSPSSPPPDAGDSPDASVPPDAPLPAATVTVVVTSPVPGAELLASEHPKIVVAGTIATTDDSRGVLEAWVNGVRVEVHDGAFSTELTPEAGVNHIKVEGGDGIGSLVPSELDVMWAPSYLRPLDGQTGFDLQGALELQLGQPFFDGRLSGTDLDRGTNPIVAKNVAAALELILWNIDLASLLPGEIHVGDPGSASLDLSISSVRPANIVVDARILDAASSAIDLTIDLDDVFLATDGRFTFGASSLVVQGGLATDLHAKARLILSRGIDGSISVGVANAQATIGALTPLFTGPDGATLNALIQVASSEFSRLISGLIVQLVPTFTNLLPPLLESLLDATDQLLDNVRFPLDIGVGTPIELQLDGSIGALELRPGATTGYLAVRQDLSIRTSSAPIHATSLGAAQLDPLTSSPVLDNAGVHLTMRQDLLNALLHALWNAGLLEGQLTFGGVTATVSAKLPPVVRPTPASSSCKIDGERCDIIIQLGQVEVQLAGIDQRFGINATAGARVEVNGNTAALKIEMVPEIRAWDTAPVRNGIPPDFVRNLVTTLVWPSLFGAIGDNLTIALPIPDLAELGLSELSPALANAQLVLQAGRRPSVAAGRVILGADISLSTPHP